MKITINELAAKLKAEFGGKTYPSPDCFNRRPATGYVIVGHCGITRAIIKAGLPIYNYWSGSLPTPSSQAPSEIVAYARKIALDRY